MKIFKKLLCVLLLFSVTALTVLFPELLSRYRTKVRSSKAEYFTINTNNSVKLTSHTVAKLLCKDSNYGGTSFNHTSGVILNNAEYTQYKMSESINLMFERVFSENTELCKHFKNIIDNSIPNTSRDYLLTVHYDRPVALSIINVSYKSGFEYLDFSFEEKTKTLISLSYVSLSEVMSNKYDTVLSVSDMQDSLEKYCRDVLKIDDNNYIFKNEKKNTAVAHENVIWFTLLSDEEKIIQEKEADIQN